MKQRKVWIYIILIFVAIIVLISLYWMFNTSLKSVAEASRVPATMYPDGLHFENYWKSLTVAPFLKYFTNTVLCQ